MEKSEELCQNVLIILFTILWKGVEGWDDNSWKLRGQVRVLKIPEPCYKGIEKTLHYSHYSSLSLLRYCWDKKKVSQYPDYRIIQYKFLMLCKGRDIDLVL